MDDAQFSRGPARRPITNVGDPLLQWATGLQTRQRTLYAGWLAEYGRNDDFDGAMQVAGFQTVVIKHGSGNYVEHWAIEVANLFVIAEGVQSIGEMKRTDDRYGIAFGWRTLQDGRQQSVLKLRAHVRELLELGFDSPLLVSVKSTLTGDLLKVLTAQYDVLDAVDRLRAADNKPALQPPFYACSIPIGPGPEVSRGSGGQTREISPPIANIPPADQITKEYILSAWLRREWVHAIESRLDDTIRWSVQQSKLIAQDEQRQAQPYDD
jgi:hypothetical protein